MTTHLIDTHVLLWWIADDPKLGEDCRSIIREPSHRVAVSSASAWEIATKFRLGKLPEAKKLLEDYVEIFRRARFEELPVTAVHALRAGSMKIAHRDPFDRMPIAQAEIENIPILTYDRAFADGPARVIPAPRILQRDESE